MTRGVIFIGGLVAAGKSSLARALAEHLHAPLLALDEIKKELYPEDPDYERNLREGIPFGEKTRGKVFDRAEAAMTALAAEHQLLVVEEVLHKERFRKQLFDAADRVLGGHLFLWVFVTDAVLAERLVKGRDNHLLTNQDQRRMYDGFAKEFEAFSEEPVRINNSGSSDAALQEAIRAVKAAP